MRYRNILFFIIFFAFLSSCDKGKKDVTLKTEEDKISYSLGWTIGKRFERDSLKVELDYIAKGIEDGMSGKALLTEAEVNDTMNKLRMKVMADRAKQRKELGEKNFREGKTFLEENKKKEGVITLPSGLQYKILKDGSGKSPTAADRVAVRYRGTLINGQEFDSSGSTGTPRNFIVNRVIPGWTEALQLMKPGSKWQLFIPSDLAYKDKGSRNIEPSSTLIFEVELVEVNPKQAPAPPNIKGPPNAKGLPHIQGPPGRMGPPPHPAPGPGR